MLRNSVLCAFLLALATLTPARAGWLGDALERASYKTVEYSLMVEDESGKAIPFPTIWVAEQREGLWNRTPAMLRRMVSRYGDDAYYIYGLSLNSGILVKLGDADGKLTWLMDAKSVADKRHDALTVSFGIIKEGYTSQVIEKSEPFGQFMRHVDVVIRLTANPSVHRDPDMDELDKLRWNAESMRLNGSDSNAAAELGKIRSTLLDMAARHESKHDDEGAARIYYYVASMPSIDVVRTETGRVISHGYTHGYDASNPDRLALMEKAVALASKTVPQMAMLIVGKKYQNLRLEIPGGKDSDRLAYLEESKKIKDASPDRITPAYYHFRYRIYLQMRDILNTCRELQEMHAFEPEYFQTAQWESLQLGVRLIQRDKGVKEGGPNWLDCRLDAVSGDMAAALH